MIEREMGRTEWEKGRRERKMGWMVWAMMIRVDWAMVRHRRKMVRHEWEMGRSEREMGWEMGRLVRRPVGDRFVLGKDSRSTTARSHRA